MTSPVFVHSLFRSGSTYIFNVFRRSTTGYTCYQEALHELPYLLRSCPRRLLHKPGDNASAKLNHPQMQDDYFQELVDAWPAWQNSLSEDAIYRHYFAPTGQDIGIAYWQALIATSAYRPVFQECRTANRIRAIREQIPGVHLYLFRNPWDQWWSFKITDYFNGIFQLLVRVPGAPAVIRELAATLALPKCPYRHLKQSIFWHTRHPLDSQDSYLVFYTLWCLGLREGWEAADLLLSIDRLSDSENYRSEIVQTLAGFGIGGLDFSDCRVSQSLYGKRDREFFQPLENRVHDLLLKNGWSQEDLQRMLTLRKESTPQIRSQPVAEPVLADLARARATALHYEDILSETASRSVTIRGNLRQITGQIGRWVRDRNPGAENLLMKMLHRIGR